LKYNNPSLAAADARCVVEADLSRPGSAEGSHSRVMAALRKYPYELRERAIRLAVERGVTRPRGAGR
jgi:hypothetical protein